MSLMHTAKHQAARRLGDDHPYLTLFAGPILVIGGFAAVGALVLWALLKGVHAVAHVTVPSPNLPGLPDLGSASWPLLVMVFGLVLAFVVIARQVYWWQRGGRF